MQSHETPTHESGQKKTPNDAKTETGKPVVPENAGSPSPVVRFKIDGTVKSLNRPVTGADLHRVSGSPKSLKHGSQEIKNDYKQVDLEDDAELKASY